MELRQLTTFREIVARGSFVRAAEALDYAQSTVTLHVQQLEAELGLLLFTRQGRKAELTEAGRALHGRADHILREMDELRQSLTDLADGAAGHLRLGVIDPTASLRLPPLLVRYCAARPNVRLSVEVGGTAGIAALVAEGALDLGVCSPPAARLGLRYEPLFVERMALLAPAEHPLARVATVRAADLPGHRLLLTEPICAYRELIERSFAERGVALRPNLEIGSMGALRHAVARGLGVGIVPVIAADPPPPGTVLRPIADAEIGLPVGLVRRADALPPSQALAALLELLRDGLGEAAPASMAAD